MTNLSDSQDKEFTEVYNRIERAYNIGRFIVIGIGVVAMMSVLIFQ
ncbi:hypothetical protein [Gramella sp. KN1008]|nr:hypothetical protein [Gramella sp. KN1008]